jgi:pyridoxine 4-dehydrogenase
VGARRDEKGGWLPAHEPDDLRRDIEVNLAALGVDQLAAVNLRVMDADTESTQPGRVNPELFDRQLSAMIEARDEGLIAGIGLSNVTLEHLQIALARTDIACVQNAFNLVDRTSAPVLDACAERGIAFVPYFPLGSGFAADNPVLGNPVVQRTAERLGHTPAQIALAWTLAVSPNVLLIPGTSSVGHLEENMAVADIELDDAIAELSAQAA